MKKAVNLTILIFLLVVSFGSCRTKKENYVSYDCRSKPTKCKQCDGNYSKVVIYDSGNLVYKSDRKGTYYLNKSTGNKYRKNNKQKRKDKNRSQCIVYINE